MRDVIDEWLCQAHIHFDADCAEVALDTARQYLGTSGLPGSVLFMLKLTALRAKDTDGAIGPLQIVQTLSQLSGLPVSILDASEQLDLWNRCATLPRG